MIKKPHPSKRVSKKRVATRYALASEPVISFTVNFYGGAGGIYFHGENIPDNQYISADMAVKKFSVQQALGHQIVTVTGSAPSSGKITVKVTSGTTVLSPASDNVFDRMTFSGFIVYEV